jgi:hypothetical protein
MAAVDEPVGISTKVSVFGPKGVSTSQAAPAAATTRSRTNTAKALAAPGVLPFLLFPLRLAIRMLLTLHQL